MHPKAEIAYDFYLILKKNPEMMEKFLHSDDVDDKTSSLFEVFKDSLALTSFEIQDAPVEFQNFIKDNNFLIDSITEYGITEPYQDFEYNIKRLKTHLKVSEVAYEYLEAVAPGNDTIEDELGYEKGELDWETFIERLDISREEVLYEQALVNLCTLFETYTSNLLKWNYSNNPSSYDKLRVSITYGEILNNYNNLLEFILNEHLSYSNWATRNDAFKSNLKFNWKELKGSGIIDEAILRRNLIIHNRGRIDKRYHKKYHSAGNINELLNTNSKYYYRVQNAVENIVKEIDQKIKEKFSQ